MLRYFFILALIASCRTKTLAPETSGSGLADINMSFDATQFPWKSELKDNEAKKTEALGSMKLQMTITSETTTCAKSADIPPQTVGKTITIPKIQLTVNCAYTIDMKITDSAGTTVFFQTAENSKKQTIPADGKINNYVICLANAGRFFEASAQVNCVTGKSDSADVTIKPEIGSGAGFDGQNDVGSFVASIKSKDENSKHIGSKVNWTLTTASVNPGISFVAAAVSGWTVTANLAANQQSWGMSVGDQVKVACQLSQTDFDNKKVTLSECVPGQ